MRKYISHINIKNYRQTPEQEQVLLASIPKQENKTDFYLRTHYLTGRFLETTPHNTPPDHAHRRLPQLGISPEQLSAQKQSWEEELHYSKQSGGPRNVQGMILNVTMSPWVTRPCHTAN